jgi:hypothetical protein
MQSKSVPIVARAQVSDTAPVKVNVLSWRRCEERANSEWWEKSLKTI